MRKCITGFYLLIAISVFSQTTSYQKAWKALNGNDRAEAQRLFAEAKNDPASWQDAYISEIYLNAYNGKEGNVTDFTTAFWPKVSDPYPYIYALWFNQAIVGQTAKKANSYQLDLINKLISDERAHGTLRASANYQMGMHYLFSNDFDKTQKYFDRIGSIRHWQYAGPFENLSESGVYKNYGPLEHPEGTAVFKSITNADVKWITPPAENPEGWIPVNYQFDNKTAVVYAQNFVSSPADQSVYCNIGVSGSIKVWVNDELVIAENKDRLTEMDAYTVKCDLKKGTNRVVIQLGYTKNSYPNFNLRFTDDKFLPLPGVVGSPVNASYPKVTASTRKYHLEDQFAEAFFLNKISKQPDNLVNYLLLADVYMRNKKIIEARNLLGDIIQKVPDNSLLKVKLIEVLVKENNRTLLLEEIEKIKQVDAESLLVLELKINELFSSQKYEEGAELLKKRISLYGEDESTADYQILMLTQEKKYDELVKTSEKLFEKYPTNTRLLEMMYTIKKEVYKDKKGAMKLYENYMKDNFNYSVFADYIDLLSEQGSNDKAADMLKKMTEMFPYSPAEFYKLSKYYYTSKQYDKAETYIRQALALSPYGEQYWEQLGDIKNEKHSSAEALEAYNQSLRYDPNQYTILGKIRKMDGKPEAFKLFGETDVDQVIKDDKIADAKNTDYGYYYILDQKQTILYPGGANEEYYISIIRITNEKGVDRYKESSIGYNNYQSLLIEKAEVLKKTMAKIQGERNDNEVVFTNLEVGDVIIFKYRLRSYLSGRFAKDYWDKYYFSSQIYTGITRYTLLVPNDVKINYVFTTSPLKPVITDVENFKQYDWKLVKGEALKDEPLMPVFADIGPILHVSTINSWKDIADWYADVCNNKGEEDFEVMAVFKKLFPDSKKNMSEFQKARIIYEYIESNIRYSSVSFRQSDFVPQRASTTLTTRLGDCKDLSNLFVTLARLAGINAQMVLVSTRDNGEKAIQLPGIEFNHCIAKTMLDNRSYYLELTDNYLPFTSLPNNLNGATILEIGSRGITEQPELQLLKADNRSRDVVKRYIDIKTKESDLGVTINTIKYGSFSASTRETYGNMENEKQVKEMEKTIAGGYKNNVKLEQISFKDLDKLNDSVAYSYSYTVKNEVSEIGSIKTFRISYPDVVASLDYFSSDTRSYPVEYCNYEDADAYETVVTIAAPAGTKFIELPASENLVFKDMKYTLQYTLKAPDKLMVVRKFSCARKNIPASDYVAFKSFFEKIVKAEQKFIAFK